jgi:hypothetical protein
VTSNKSVLEAKFQVSACAEASAVANAMADKTAKDAANIQHPTLNTQRRSLATKCQLRIANCELPTANTQRPILIIETCHLLPF